MQIHILSRSMAYAGLSLLKHLPFNWVDSLMTWMSKIVYGDLGKYGIQRPKEGPFALKVKYGKYPVIDVGTFDKIKSGEIQVTLFSHLFFFINYYLYVFNYFTKIYIVLVPGLLIVISSLRPHWLGSMYWITSLLIH